MLHVILLHTAPVTRPAMSVVDLDWRFVGVLFCVGAAFGALLAGLCESHFSAFPVRARSVARVCVVTLAFLAAGLNVVPYDHLFFDDHNGRTEVHAAHCHVAPGTCADAPVPAGPGQLIFTEQLLAKPALAITQIVVVVVRTLAGQTLRPDLRPPIA